LFIYFILKLYNKIKTLLCIVVYVFFIAGKKQERQ